MIALIDNYDSFSYNLVQLLGGLGAEVNVFRNDAITVSELQALRPEKIVLSPGPGYPKDAGICEAVIRNLSGTVPILGVCLGHQAICEAFGAEIIHAAKLMHGKQSMITIDTDSPLFAGLPEQLPAARYHSLAAKRESLPDCLQIIGKDSSGEIMAVAHTTAPVFGLQFHPESILTPDGSAILRNFLSISF